MAKRKAKAESGIAVINRRFDPECPLDKLTKHPRNPRQGDIGALHLSMEHNGFYGALVAQESTGHILAGNHRFMAAEQKGATTIPVIWVDCDDAAAARIVIADNRTNDIASYDDHALAELLESIRIDETELGFLGTGWDDEAYQQLMQDLNPQFDPTTAEEQGRLDEKKKVTCPSCGHEFAPGS
jgi:uncharacterized Zn-finger protein